MHRCVVNGTPTFQSEPCPDVRPRQEPNLERLNALEKKKREAAAKADSSQAKPPATDIAREAPSTRAAHTAPSGFSCDGRKHCSQMRSCQEAKYFLANCPGVQMDGDRDGIPCEQQWCGR